MASPATLTELANQFGSDKGTTRGMKHNYTALYEMIFRPVRNEPVRLLEIGLLIGGPEMGRTADRTTSAPPSIRMWLDYFPNASVIGFDISDFSNYHAPRFTFRQGDSGSALDLSALANEQGPFDIIIDDGSHASYHQLLAFRILFPALNPGGIYIIEDLQWQPPVIEASLPSVPKARDVVRRIMETGKCEDFTFPPELTSIRDIVEKIGFVHIFPQLYTANKTDKCAVFHKKI